MSQCIARIHKILNESRPDFFVKTRSVTR